MSFDTLLPRPVSVTPLPGTCPWPVQVDIRRGSGPAESYRLEIDPVGVTLYAADGAGEFYGRQTLRQLIGPDAFRAASIHSGQSALPCGVVEDQPRFGWRGCLLDVARHFRTKAEVLRFVDLLAAHKLNVLNLHLTDDQGWRVEIPAFPRLASVGSWRRSSMVGRHDGPERDGRPHGGFYTTDDLREIVAYAAERAVTVVPEIDVPGHARAAIAAYPSLGGVTEAEVWTGWGISTSLLVPAESTLDFFRQVFDHVLNIFPSPVIALGGDEVPGATEAHGEFVRAIAAYLISRGRTPMGWDEVLEIGSLPPMVIGAWRSEDAAVVAAEAGHEVVLCPEDRVYLDHRQSDHPDEPIPVTGYAQDTRATLERAAAAMGASGLTTLEYTAAGTMFDVGQSAVPGQRGSRAPRWRARPLWDQTESAHVIRQHSRPAPVPAELYSEELLLAFTGGDYGEFLPRLRDHHVPRLDALGVEYRPLDGPHPWQTRPGVPGRPR